MRKNYDFSNARRNPYAKKIAEQGITIQIDGGRPRRLSGVGAPKTRAVRLPDAVWKRVEKLAKRRRMSVQTVLREAILAWLTDAE